MDPKIGDPLGISYSSIYDYPYYACPYCLVKNSVCRNGHFHLTYLTTQQNLCQCYYYMPLQVSPCQYQKSQGQVNPNELCHFTSVQQTQATMSPCNTEQSSGFQDSHAVIDKKSFFNWVISGEESSSYGISSEDIIRTQCSTFNGNLLENPVDPNRLESSENALTQQRVVQYKSTCDFSPGNTEDNLAKCHEQDLSFSLKSLPSDLFSCDYENAEVASLVSSMDYFYNTSTYGVTPLE